jgi:hypothetical protein
MQLCIAHTACRSSRCTKQHSGGKTSTHMCMLYIFHMHSKMGKGCCTSSATISFAFPRSYLATAYRLKRSVITSQLSSRCITVNQLFPSSPQSSAAMLCTAGHVKLIKHQRKHYSTVIYLPRFSPYLIPCVTDGQARH